MKREIRLPNCKIVKDRLTGASHNVCPVIDKDHGERGLMVSSYQEDKLLSSIGEVADWAREHKVKSTDRSSMLRMASKTFRESRKLEKETSGGVGYGLFNGWGKKRRSSSV